MNRTVQYLIAAGTAAVALLFGYAGFVFTGGAVPMDDRFGAVLDGGVGPSGGSLVQFGRGGIGGFLLAEPVRDGFVVFVAIVAVLVVGSVLLYRSAPSDARSEGKRPR